MASRYSEAEKGKHHVTDETPRSIKRIKAPSLDNAALIKANELTLIGRLTNPQIQKIWALIPSLPKKWHLQGRAVGSDLGNNCFQFRFEREDDLQRTLSLCILDDHPAKVGTYHLPDIPIYDSFLDQNQRAPTPLLAR